MLSSDLTLRSTRSSFRPPSPLRPVAHALSLVGLLLALSAESVSAQSTPNELAEANRGAMESYNALELDKAKAELEAALAAAEAAGIRGTPLARTYANLGVVLIGGFGDKAGAIAKFKRALREDPRIEPDPVVATPEVAAAFHEARGTKGRSKTPPAPRIASSIAGNLDHAPVLEQLVQTAIPVFVEKHAELTGATIRIYYRSSAMTKPKSAELQETDAGFTYLIPCSDVLEPVVEYFLIALDVNGVQIGHSGTPEQPIGVAIVDVRSTQAPALPGQLPPSQCSDGASDRVSCTPGDPGCDKRPAGLGATCARDSDCGEGLVCSDDFCSVPKPVAEDDGARSAKRFFFDVNFGVGATYVGTGRAPDHSPPADVRSAATARAEDADGRIDAEQADRELQIEGWDCDTAVVDDGDTLRVQNCGVAVKPGGFVAVPVINLAAGYYVTPRFALALTSRIQVTRGQGALAGILLGARAEFLLTKPAPRGFRFALLGGASVGQMQARPPAQGEGNGPYATNAALKGEVAGVGMAASLGARTGYRFMPNLGFTVSPIMHFGFPNFLFDLDLAAGVEVAF